MGFRSRQADNVDDYEFEITFFTAAIHGSLNGFYFDDRNTGAVGTAVTTLDVELDFEMLIVQRGAVVKVFGRSISPRGETPRTGWTSLHTETLTSDTTTPNAAGEVSFGKLVTGGVQSKMYFRLVNQASVAAARTGLSGGFTNPDDLFPRPIGARGVTLYGHVKLSAVDGPAMQGETWTITGRSLYGVENIDPAISPSPRHTWRTTGETEETVSWNISDSNARQLGSTLGIYIGGANWRTGTLYGYDGTFLTALISIDLADGQTGLAYTRTGNMIQPNSTPDVGYPWPRNALAGASLDFNSSSVVRKISRNTEGHWTDASNTMTPFLYMAGITDAEATSGTGAHISMPAGLFVEQDHSAFAWQNYELVIDAQDTADGYLETGVIVIGSVHYLAQQYSHGRIISLEPNTEVTTRAGGTRTSRVLGPARHTVELTWAEGVDTSSAYGSTPDYINTGTASPIVAGLPPLTPLSVQGLIEEIDGPHTPIAA